MSSRPQTLIKLKNPFQLLCSIFVLILSLFIIPGHSFPEQGKWTFNLTNEDPIIGISKSLFQNTTIYVSVSCNSTSDLAVSIKWMLRGSNCWEEYNQLNYLPYSQRALFWKEYNDKPNVNPTISDYTPGPRYQPPKAYKHRCDSSISLPMYPKEQEFSVVNENMTKFVRHEKDPIFSVPDEGVYLFVIEIQPEITSRGSAKAEFQATVKVEMKSRIGYISIVDYPLLSFYGIMCCIYVLYGITWLSFSAKHWRDLLRLQFWIGGVIFLGMLEMAIFYSEYQTINSTGQSQTGTVLCAEIVSCAKRTLARLLIVIVCVGFGIVKPRLGPTLYKITIVGVLYFVLATTESTFRILHPKGVSNVPIISAIPLSLLDAGICFWVFQALVSTMRTLRLRRNLVKLSLYRNFTNALIFTVVASVAFMIWSLRFIRGSECLSDWKQIWIDEAFWHVQFAVILLVIIILWKPTNNNQRYSFSPLLDNPDDEDEEDLVINEAFANNMKLRPKQGAQEKPKKYRNQNVEDDLKWVEENIPADFGEGDLRAIDSDEEIAHTKFELSKMQ